MMQTRKHKYISIAIVVALLAQVAVITFPKFKQEVAEENTTQQDQQIATDLSNLTGVAVEHIMKLKTAGVSWNEVSETLKAETAISTDEEKADRTTLLNEAGLGEEAMHQLRQKGFQDDEIMEAKLLTERIMLQLKEVMDHETSVVEKPSTGFSNDQSEEVELQAAYEKINAQFDEGQAVKLILMLQQEMGSMEAVLNEYLLSLQMDLNLEAYITDKKQYQEDKDQKTVGLKASQMVTVENLEKAMLDRLQHGNKGSTSETVVVKPSTVPALLSDKEAKSPLPDIKPPTIKDVMPPNPAEQVRQELQAINPNQ